MLSSDRALAHFSPEPPTLSPGIVLGRTLAFCVHPIAAWQVLSAPWRLLILSIYALAAFVLVLSALLLAA